MIDRLALLGAAGALAFLWWKDRTAAPVAPGGTTRTTTGLNGTGLPIVAPTASPPPGSTVSGGAPYDPATYTGGSIYLPGDPNGTGPDTPGDPSAVGTYAWYLDYFGASDGLARWLVDHPA